MNRIVSVVLTAALLAGHGLNAQSLVLGAKGGLNFATLSIEEETGEETRTDFAAGAFLRVGLGGLFALQPEVLFTGKGFEDTDQGETAALDLSYIQVPLLLRLSPPVPGSPVKPHGYVGPAVSFETSCRFQVEDATTETDVACDDPLLDGEIETKSVDFGVVFGGGVDFNFTGFVLGIEGRYELGLTSINDLPSPDDNSAKNRVFSIMASIGIKLPPGI